jgi:hypothetical protein
MPQAQLSLLDYLDGYLPGEADQDDNSHNMESDDL